ncbi:MAG: diguanylate cyclase [Pseudomonadota bacterium]|nr:diguanylate cyclase [Pseudomonadota bacterium]
MPGKILVVEAIATNRIVIRARLTSGLFNVLLAASAQEAMEVLDRDACDLILVNSILYDMPLRRFCRKLQQRENCPPLIILQPENSAEKRRKLLQWGAEDVLPRPIGDELLFARLRAAIRDRPTPDEVALARSASEVTGKAAGLFEATDRPPLDAWSQVPTATMMLGNRSVGAGIHRERPRIQVTHPDAHTAALWQHQLAFHLQADLTKDHPENLLNGPYQAKPPDCIVLPICDPIPREQLRLLTTLRAKPGLRRAQVLVVVQQGHENLAAEALDLGAQDVMLHSTDAQEMALRLSKLSHRKWRQDLLQASLKEGLAAAITDPLTGVSNRRHGMLQLADVLADPARQPVALALLDIDHFKQVNDLHGHDAGDAVLVELAQRLRAEVPDGALLARIGGEEFLIALPATQDLGAQRFARSLCRDIAARPFALPDGASIRVTVSLGLAMSETSTGDEDGIDPAQDLSRLMKRADQALYRAKAAGRNQVNLSQSVA